MLLTDVIKDSMVNPLDIHSLKSIYTMAGLMKHVYTRYVSDMNIILSAMRPIFNLSPPTGDVKASKNIDTILSIIDTIKVAGLTKLQMVQELVISAYGGCSIHKPRVMLTEEDEYADGLYATNDSERNPKLNSADQKANGGYNRGNITSSTILCSHVPLDVNIRLAGDLLPHARTSET